MPYQKLQPAYDTSLETLNHALTTIAQLSDQLTELTATYKTCHTIKEGRRAQLDGYLPMWPHCPTSEQLTDRNGNGTYLYLYWSLGEGPQPRPDRRPQRKTYIGARPANIALARAMTANHTRYLELLSAIDALRRDAQYITADLSRIAARADRSITCTQALIDPDNGGEP